MKKALAFDIGGTKIYSTIIDEKGSVIGEINKFSTPKSIEGIESVLKTEINKHEDEVDVIAIATAGAVNNENTAVIGSTGNLVENYSSINFQNLSKKKVFIENDANSASWAEYKIGASKNCLNSIMITLGTGVGGGIIINGQLLKGKSGSAGEMHFKMYSDKRRKCTCGSYDCFEIYASGTALKITAEEITKNPNITTYDVIDGVKNNDKTMIKILNIWQDYIIQGLIGLSNLFDPECFVLSGSMAEFVDAQFIEKSVNSEIIPPDVKIYKACAGNYSGMIGASLLAFERVF